MSDDPRSYLLHRFLGDAATLRARAAQLAGAPPRHGPDAAASGRMARACDDVVAHLQPLPTAVAGQLDALEQLVPRLRALADGAADPFVRSVYGGAATRIADIVTRERALAADDDAAGGPGDAADEDPAHDADEDADEDEDAAADDDDEDTDDDDDDEDTDDDDDDEDADEDEDADDDEDPDRPAPVGAPTGPRP
jgi:hypothetical protein